MYFYDSANIYLIILVTAGFYTTTSYVVKVHRKFL